MTREIKCVDCPYYWVDADGEIAYCHYQYDDGYAPCEIEDRERETENDEN